MHHLWEEDQSLKIWGNFGGFLRPLWVGAGITGMLGPGGLGWWQAEFQGMGNSISCTTGALSTWVGLELISLLMLASSWVSCSWCSSCSCLNNLCSLPMDSSFFHPSSQSLAMSINCLLLGRRYVASTFNPSQLVNFWISWATPITFSFGSNSIRTSQSFNFAMPTGWMPVRWYTISPTAHSEKFPRGNGLH